MDALDCLRDPAQTFGSAPVLGCEIANICSRGGIARVQLLEYHVLLRMMVGIGIDLEIGNNCPDNLVVRSLSAIKNAQLLLKNKEQLTASGWCAPHPKRGWAALPGAGQGVCRAGARYAAPGTVITF